MQLSFSPAGGYATVVVMGLALLALLALGPGKSRVNRTRRWTLSGLRSVIIVMTILAMLRPTLVWTSVTKRPATLVLLVDSSRSMQVADSIGNRTRWQALRSALEEAWPALTDLGDDLELKLYDFDADVRSLDPGQGPADLPQSPEGQQSAIGYALEQVLERESGKRIAGVVLLTDGAQRALGAKDLPPQTSARRLADLGYSLYAIPFGQARGPDQARDVALTELRANNAVFVKNPLEVGAISTIAGLVNQDIPVQLSVETAPGKMEVVGATKLRAGVVDNRLPVVLEYVPRTAGEIKISLKALPQPGELVTTNNELSTFVTVLDGGLNVLFLDGARLPEQKYLRWSLDASPDINVDQHYINATKPQTRPTDMAEWFKPGKYNVYILGDLDAKAFTAEELTALRNAIEKGAGLIMLGGLHSFGAGGYGSTPLADVLPIKIDRTERQNFDEAVRGDLHLANRPKPKMKPTKLGLGRSPMLLASADRNQAAWDQLPPLDGANRFAGIKPSASVLAETPDGKPLLVAQEFGAGRVLAFAGDSTWHWWMAGHEAAHKRFWRQVVLWLARKDSSDTGSVWVELDERRYAPGGKIEFKAGAKGPDGQPIAGATIEAEVCRPDGSAAPVRLRRQDDDTAGTYLDALTPGDYTLVVKATAGGQLLGTAQARFLVFEQDLELDNPAADRGALEGLTAMTGGRTVAPEQFQQLIEQLKSQLVDLEVETQAKETLWDNWLFFLTLVGLMAGEWFLRKKWGLV